MSSSVYALPLRLELHPSRRIMSAVIAGHAIAVLISVALPVPGIVILTLVLAIAAQFVIIWRRHVLFSARYAVRSLVWKPEDIWELTRTDGAKHEARLLPTSYLHPLIVILRFETGNKRRYSVMLLQDSVDADTYRRLRVLLRLRSGRESVENF